jgi:hypothetical protein
MPNQTSKSAQTKKPLKAAFFIGKKYLSKAHQLKHHLAAN